MSTIKCIFLFSKDFHCVIFTQHRPHKIRFNLDMDLYENFLQMDLPNPSRSQYCGLCKIQVDNKAEHFQMIHDWVRCTFCRSTMDSGSLNAHLDRKHKQKQPRRNKTRAQKRKYDRNANEEHNQNYDLDEPKTPPQHQPDDQAKRPRLANEPYNIIQSNANYETNSSSNQMVAVTDNVSPIETPKPTSVNQFFNKIYISDGELNKLMGIGRIGCQNGYFFLRDSDTF